jgi:hypothetical protein
MVVDTRLLLVLVASLVVTSCAEIGGSEVQAKEDETLELKELLRAVKHYLDIKDKDTEKVDVVTENKADADETKPPLRTAYDDSRTVYATGTTEQDISNAETGGTGYWTKWMDADSNPSNTLGEYEDCSRVKWMQNAEKRCYLGCRKPIAASYAAASDKIKGTWTDIENCIGPMDTSRVSECGFTCLDKSAKDFPKTDKCDIAKCVDYGLGDGCNLCPDVRVRFFCMGQAPPENQCCPYSSGCTTSSIKNLKEALKEVENVDTRYDVIAGILSDIHQVLENEPQK